MHTSRRPLRGAGLWAGCVVLACLGAGSASAQDEGAGEAPAGSGDETVPSPKPAEEGEEQDLPPLVRDGEYHTPLAGQGFSTEIFGREVQVPPRDRGSLWSLSLGAALWRPKIGETAFSPLAAFYIREYWLDDDGETERFLRLTFSGVVNSFDFAENLGVLDAVVHFENDYRRYLQPEPTVDDESVEVSALQWGWADAWAGVGYRTHVWPFTVDNELRVEAFYHAAYYSFDTTRHSAPTLAEPPETFVHGLRARVRLDMIQRNLFEMPHEGFAFGADVDLSRRDVWPERGPTFAFDPDPSRVERTDETRDYLKLWGYLVGAARVPFLDTKHRLVAIVQGGWSPHGDLDRFSAFRVGGGPVPKESFDLARTFFPGALFNQFIAQRYASVTVEYRYELLFFLFLHFRASYFIGRIADRDLPSGAIAFETQSGPSFGAAITTGFVLESELHVSYSYDRRLARGGEDGHTVLIQWSKAF